VKIINCNACGTNNRIKGFSLRRIPICGNCRIKLQEIFILRYFRFTVKYKYWVILIAIIGSSMLQASLFSNKVGALSSSYTPPSRTESNPLKFDTPTASSRAKAHQVYSSVHINQGILKKATKTEAIAPFTIITPSGQENYYIKLVDAFTGKLVRSFYVHGGQNFTTEVPLGTFKVKYAIGQTWYGKKLLFGDKTRYSEADKLFNFTVEGNEVSGFTVELVKQRGGNLHTRSIPVNQF
jgi:hypothetical protein